MMGLGQMDPRIAAMMQQQNIGVSPIESGTGFTTQGQTMPFIREQAMQQVMGPLMQPNYGVPHPIYGGGGAPGSPGNGTGPNVPTPRTPPPWMSQGNPQMGTHQMPQPGMSGYPSMQPQMLGPGMMNQGLMRWTPQNAASMG